MSALTAAVADAIDQAHNQFIIETREYHDGRFIAAPEKGECYARAMRASRAIAVLEELLRELTKP